MYFPSIEEFEYKAKEGNLVPVWREISADIETPVSAFMKIGESPYSFLLESVEGGEKWARYSFLGCNPWLIFRSKGKTVQIIEGGKIRRIEVSADPLILMKETLSRFKLSETEGLPRFFGGAVGYLSYDMVRFFEDLPDKNPDEVNFFDSLFLIPNCILIFDNLKQTIKVVSYAYPTEDKNQAYEVACQRIEEIIQNLRRPLSLSKGEKASTLDFIFNLSKEGFKVKVLKAKEYIKAGDIIQVVLSQRLQTRYKVNPFSVYRALRRINPSPYMYFLKFEDEFIIGSSPEVLVRLEEGKIEVKPIAGTRPRGQSPKEDEFLKKELLSDPKERAEHVMLVDLGRNDVGRVSRIGTVKVSEFMTVEFYSHVMHLVSNVEGLLDKGKDCFEVLRATFPAGTVSGAPKIRAMEIIEELEDSKRGPYAGAVGYFSFSGNMDFCITIRTILIKKDMIYFQTGAGIVADSDPEREYEETIQKAQAMIKAVEIASKGLD